MGRNVSTYRCVPCQVLHYLCDQVPSEHISMWDTVSPINTGQSSTARCLKGLPLRKKKKNQCLLQRSLHTPLLSLSPPRSSPRAHPHHLWPRKSPPPTHRGTRLPHHHHHPRLHPQHLPRRSRFLRRPCGSPCSPSTYRGPSQAPSSSGGVGANLNKIRYYSFPVFGPPLRWLTL